MAVKRPHITPSNIVVHHSLTARDSTTPESINRYHKKVFGYISTLGSYVGYQYIIDGRGNITKHRSNNEPGAHTKQQAMNFNSIGICLTGNFDKERPSPAQVNQLTELLWQLHVNYGINPEQVFPHREFATYKSCYGTNLPDFWAASLLRARIQQNELRDGRSDKPVAAVAPKPDNTIDLKKEARTAQRQAVLDEVSAIRADFDVFRGRLERLRQMISALQ